MKIGLLGFGTVGSGVYEIIQNNKNFEISKILIRDENKIYKENMTTNPDEVLNDENIDIIVEVMGGIHPAFEYIIKALKSGKHVITANKAVVSKYLNEFTKIAKENQVAFSYEASVGGGIPWIKSIKQAKRIDDISKVYGIFNGTSNFILYNMFENGYDFQSILKIAQDKGYAESDPSADIDGIDIQRKLSITSSLAFDHIIHEENIPTFGIRNVTKMDIDFFKNINMTLKLIAMSIKQDDKYCSFVLPVLFQNNSIEANISDNFNIGCLTGTTIGDLKFYGQGAGKLPTGNAIVQDIIDIHTGEYNNYSYDYNKNLQLDLELTKDKYYVRFSNEDVLALFKNKIEKQFKIESSHVIITTTLTLKESQDIFNQIKAIDPEFFYAKFN